MCISSLFLRLQLCVPMPTHCTITCFGFRARRIDGVQCGLFTNNAPLDRPHYVWDEYLYSVQEKVEVRVTGDCMCNYLCSVIVLCGMMMKGREKVKPGAGS